MSVLIRATELLKRPVVTLHGEDVAEIKDVVYLGDRGEVAGFTLNGRGFLAGPLRQALPWSAVHAVGPDAVMVAGEDSFEDRDGLLARGAGDGAGGDVLHSRVLTDTGIELGEVTEVIIEIGDRADVVGYEIESSEGLGSQQGRVFVPVPDTLAVSAEALIVPAVTVDFITADLTGFGSAVKALRDQLHGSESSGASA